MLDEAEEEFLGRIESFEAENEEIRARIAESRNPAFLQQIAEIYNWDDGFEVPKDIAEHASCDRATALTLFWLAEGISLYDGSIEEVAEEEREWADFCRLLGQRLVDGHYPLGVTSFDPELSKVQVFKLQKAGVPAELFEAIEPG